MSRPYNSNLRGKPGIGRGIPRGRPIIRSPRRGTSSTGRVLLAKEHGHLSGRNFDSSASRHYSSSTEYSDRQHSSERYRSGSGRRSRSPSYESSRHRSSRYRSSRSRSRSRSPTSHSRRRSRSPSWSRSSPQHRHRSRTPSPGADLDYDHGRNLRYFDVVSRPKPSHTEDVESALSPNKRSPSPIIIEKQIYYPPGSSQLEASRKESLRITVDNDRFGSSPVPIEVSSETASVWGKPVPAGAEGLYKQSVPKKKKGKKGPAQPQSQQDDMSRKWGRDRDNDRGKDRNAASAVPVWMIPKVMNVRDMDVFDDDIQSSRISSRATPPPDLKPPRPKTPPPPSRPFMKTEGKPRPEDINIFTNIAERSWDSPFLDDTPVHRREASPAPSGLPGLGTDDEKPLRSILRKKPDGTPFDRVVKDEPEEVSNFVIPGLGDMDIDDEDRFLYGEDADQGETASPASHTASRSEDHGSSSYVQQQQQHHGVASSSNSGSGASSRSVARERSQDYQGSWDSVEKSKSQNDVDQAKLESFLKSIGLDIDKQKATTSSARVSVDAVQRGAQVTQTIMDYYNNRTQASGSGSKPEKQVDSKIQIAKTEPAQLYRHQAPPLKQEPQDSYSDFSNATHSYPPPVASEPTHAPVEHYASYPVQPPAMPPVPTYPSYSYDRYYDVRYPPPQPPPVPQELPLPHFAVPPPNILYPPPLMSTPVQQNWTPPSTQPLSSANRSNLKVIPLQNTQSDSLSGTTTTTTAIVGSASSPLSDKQTPTTPTINSAPAMAAATDEIREPTTLAERKKLRQQRDESKAKLTLLMVELDRLRKQQGELMRKKQRQKDGHNDPHLLKTNQLISDIDRQVAASKKKLELMDQHLRASQSLSFVSVSGSSNSGSASTQMTGGSSISTSIEAAKSKGNQETDALERPKLDSGSKSNVSSKTKVSGIVPASLKQYRFIDNCDHWCKHCNDIFPLATDLLKHLHSKHFNIMETVAPADRPWATKPKESKSVPGAEFTLLGFKGVEFMMPCQAFYCNLCKEFSGDIFAGRNHLESDKHNSNYSKFCRSNPNYVKRIQADRAASLARKREESKRKIEESLKDSKSYKRARSESSSKGSLKDDYRHSPSRDEYRERPSSRDSRKDYRRRSPSRDRSSNSRDRSSNSRDRSSNSRDRKSTSRDRELSENDDVIAEDDDTSTKRSLSTTKSGIRLNLLKSKDKADKENSPSSKSEDDDRERIITISKPGAKIPIKIKGKGISASGPPAKLAKKAPSSTMTVEQQRTQRILSNMLKKMKHDKAEKAEAQKRPQPLEEFVCISSDGYVEDPKKAREREMAATVTVTTVAPNDRTEEESQEKVTIVKITPNLPKMPSPKKDANEASSSQLSKIVVEEESLPEDGSMPEVGPQLPKDFDSDFSSLTNVLTAIPLPPELDDDDDIIFEKEVCPPANNNVSTVVNVVDEETSQTEKKTDSVAEENEGVSKSVEIGNNSKESIAITNELKESITAKGTSEEAAAVSEDLSSKDGSSECLSKDQSTAKDGLVPSEANNSDDTTVADMELGTGDAFVPVMAASSDSTTAKDSTSKIADAKDDFAETSSTKNGSLDNVTVSNEPSEFTVTEDNLTSEVTNEFKITEMTAGGEFAVANADISESSVSDRTESLVKKDVKESSAAGGELMECPLEGNDSAVGQKEDMNENSTAKETEDSVEAQSLISTTDNKSSNSTVQENAESGEGVSTLKVEEFKKTEDNNQTILESTVNVTEDKEQESAKGEISATDSVSAFVPEAGKDNAMEDSHGLQVEAEANSADDSVLKANNGEQNDAKQLDVSQEAAVDDKVDEDAEMKSVADDENVPAEQKQPIEMASESEISMEIDKVDSSTTLDELIHKESEPSEVDTTGDILADANAETAPSTHDDDHVLDLLGDSSTSLTENVEAEAKDVSLPGSEKEAVAELSEVKEEHILTSLKGDGDDLKADDENEGNSETKSTSVMKERQLSLCSRGRSKRIAAKTSKADGTTPLKAMAKSTKGSVKQSQVEGPAATMKVKSVKAVKTLKRKAKPAEADDQAPNVKTAEADDQGPNVKTAEAETGVATEQTNLESKPATKAKAKIAKVLEKSSDVKMKPSIVEGKITKAGTRPGTVVKKSTNIESGKSSEVESKSTNFQGPRTVAKAKPSKTMVKTTKVAAVRSSKTTDLKDEVEEKSSKDVGTKPFEVEKSDDSEVDIETCDMESVDVPEPPKRRQVAICSRGRGLGRRQVTTRSCTVVLRQEPLPLPTRTRKEPNKTRAAVTAKNTKGIVPVKQGTPPISKGDDNIDDELISPGVEAKRKRVERQMRGRLSKRVIKRTPIRAKPKPVEEPEEPDEESAADLSFEGQDIERTLEFLRNLESNTGDAPLKNNSEQVTHKDPKEGADEKSPVERGGDHVETNVESSHSSSMLERDDQPLTPGKTGCKEKEEDEEGKEKEIEKDKDEEREIEDDEENVEEMEDGEEKVKEVEDDEEKVEDGADDEEKVEEVEEEEEDEEKVEEVEEEEEEEDEEKMEEVEEDDEEKVEDVEEEDDEEKVEDVEEEDDEEKVEDVEEEDDEEKVEEIAEEEDEEKVEEIAEEDDEEKVEEIAEEDDEEKVEEIAEEDDEEKVEEIAEEDDEEKVEEVEEEEEEDEEKVEEVEEDDDDEEKVEVEDTEEEKVEEVEEGEEEEDGVDLDDTSEQVDDVTEEMEDELLQEDDAEEMLDGEAEGDDNLESDLLNDPLNASQANEDACSDISMADMEVVDEAEDSE